jgi:hypothetical protein
MGYSCKNASFKKIENASLAPLADALTISPTTKKPANMSRKLALKKLKPSDLSIFQAYLNQYPQTKLKGFKLDRSVVEKSLFPSLSAAIGETSERWTPVALTIVGPDAAPPYLLMRLMFKAQNNWRLNGEAIYNPDGEPHRFNAVAPGDIAVMEFSGASIPEAVKVVLLSATMAGDAATHAAFARAFPAESMSVLTEEDIERAIQAAATPADHPIRDWLDKDLLEELGQGSSDAAQRLLVKRKARGVSSAELKKARAGAEAVGRLGEELLHYHLEAMAGVEIKSCEWVADVNAISPFDFLINCVDGTIRHVDAKSTAGPFGNPIHLSFGEIQHAIGSGVPFDLYRLNNVRDTGATLRVSKDIARRLIPIVQSLKSLPSGVKVDSLSFSPDYFGFDPTETAIDYDDE